ncbi:MAG: sugar phosphate nucleotidyltransferase [Myxococcota bacterium]
MAFGYRAPNARAVCLSGTFNDWSSNATPMRRDARGNWSLSLRLRPGRYEYKLVVDGEWRCESACALDTHCVPNAFGTTNRLLEVAPPNGTWAIVLAGGEGSRLRHLTTTPAGVSVPKQFCSLSGGPSLLRQTIERAAALVPRDRIVVVVSEAHRAFWRDELDDLPRKNVIVQPEGRGTGPGILLPALRIRRDDPEARVLVLPSDHHVEDEATLRESLRAALRGLRADPARIVLLGITPDAADSQYGWIVPGAGQPGDTRGIECFVEKPPEERASQLFARGALWSSFIFACRVSSLLEAFEFSQPHLLRALEDASRRSAVRDAALATAYATLEPTDFSRAVLERVPQRLGVIAVPPCGWSDLGTPDRISHVLSARGNQRGARPTFPAGRTCLVVLSQAIAAVSSRTRPSRRALAAP